MYDINKELHLKAELPVDFCIKKSQNIFSIGNRDLLSLGSQGKGVRRIVIVDYNVSKLYLDGIKKYLISYGVQYRFIIIDAIEKNKSIETLLYILDEIESFGPNRRDEPLIVVGGGVLLDIVGMAASLYRRGIPYIKIPTTLLGLVDASIGIKTGINFKDRRNRLGTYFPPVATYLDTTFLNTLDYIEISSGLGEILKLAVIKDIELFDILKQYGNKLYKNKFADDKVSTEVINRSIIGMKNELQENLWEKELKRYVDFGHSFSPIPEIRSLTDGLVPSLTHGQAVTLDVIFSSIISHVRGMFSKLEVFDVMYTARNMGLLTIHPYFLNSDVLMEALNDTIKHRNGNQNLPIPKTIGSSIFINDLTYEEVLAAVKMMKEFNDELTK